MSFIRPHGSGRGIGSSLAGALAAAVLMALAIVGPTLASDRGSHLVDAHVSPRFGTPATSIVFTVMYRDSHGDPADAVNLLIDGSARPMTADGGSILGEACTTGWRRRCRSGIHLVEFKASAPGGHSYAPAGLVKIRTTGDDGTGGNDPGGATGGGTTGGDSPNGGTGGDGGATGPQASTDPATTGDAPGSPASTPGTSTGGGHTSRNDPPASTSHPKGTTGSGATKTGPAPTKTPRTAGQSTAAPDMPVASADSSGDANSENVLAFGAGSDSAGSKTGGTGDDGGSTLSDRTLTALGFGGMTPTERMVLAAISTTTTTTTIMAFIVFGKRRRDGEPPAPDEVLAANAARLVSMASSGSCRSAATNPGQPQSGRAESDLPRWRRPSLLAARKADPLRSTASTSTLSFDRGVAAPIAGRERRRIRYRLVRLLDAPDELRSAEIGVLDQGDEVQLLELVRFVLAGPLPGRQPRLAPSDDPGRCRGGSQPARVRCSNRGCRRRGGRTRRTLGRSGTTCSAPI